MDNYKKNFALLALRRSSMRWKFRNLAKNKNRRKIEVEIKTKKGNYKRETWHYQCSLCPEDKWYRESEIQLDHVFPVIDEILGWVSFDDFIDRLLVEESGFQRLCLSHHQEKTQKENLIRTVSRKARKNKNTS